MTKVANLIAAHERFARNIAGGCRTTLQMARLHGLNIQKRYLPGIQFIGCDLTEARMALTDLTRASLYCSNLQRADLRGSNLTQADMRGTCLRGARLYAARLDDADLRGAVLFVSNSQLDIQSLRHEGDDRPGEGVKTVDFRDCSMKKVRLNGARLAGADFSGAILEGAQLAGADLDGAKFDNAILTGANLTNARLSPDALANAVIDPSPEAVERKPALIEMIRLSALWASSGGREGQQACFDGEDLRVIPPASLANQSLAGASLRGVCGIGVDFSNSILVGAVFDGSDLRDANFSGADLRGCSFRNCRLSHASFVNTDLSSIDGKDGRKHRPQFGGAVLLQADFTNVRCDPDWDLASLAASPKEVADTETDDSDPETRMQEVRI
jgi:uncharacterized protein YjbI with pentapeptide repeats